MSATAKWTLTVLAVLALLTAGTWARIPGTGLPEKWTPLRRVEVRVLRDATEASEEFGERSLEDAMPSSLALRSFGKDHDVKLRLRREPLLNVRENMEDVGSEVTALPDAAVYTDPELSATVIVRRHSGGHLSMEGRWEHEDREVHISPVVDNTTRRSADSSVGHVVEEYPRLVGRRSEEERAAAQYVVELLLLADNSDYRMWGNWAKTNTIAEMTLYYTFMAKDLRRRYASIERVKLDVRVVGLEIMTDPAKSPWQNSDANKALDDLIVWLGDNASKLPKADNYATFTALPMTFRGSTIYGLAEVGKSCNKLSVSVTMDQRSFARDALYLAHEVGHNLGMYHASSTACWNFDGHVMTSKSFRPNNWLFTPCSVDRLIKHIQRSPCIEATGGPMVLKTDKLGGQYMDVNAQCALRLRGGKWDGKNLDKICYVLKCHNSDTHKYIQPLDFTHCGTNKWCYQGRCVAKTDVAPDDAGS